ncbi:hypothetical protein HYH03_006576 [Edaphochlamys debaryana]|uniref:tRNA-binding domain-containing protein n=1 Tax=Edaphochlamys debaryana TaxID=47281 RepID=A0A835YD34_9CHLO|nr:hypothetical protein HYH03_006576 [Edaphochlamys debaryana]|eukprot:KAG2495304.1 hypothetical protein HYH03_006576 [Edaphochlamys debaryana]
MSAETAARFVARQCGSNEQPSTSGSGVQLLVGKDTVVSGLAAVCTHLARQSPRQANLLGATPELQAQVAEWLAWASSELTPLMDDKLAKLNEHLLSRTYLVGTSATLADLVIYALVHAAAVGFPAAQTLHFAALLRWVDLLQNTEDRAGFMTPRLELAKPRYVAPPPPPPPAPKAAPAGKEEAKGADKAAPKADAPAAKEAGGKKEGGKEGAKKDAAAAAPAAAAAAAPAAAAAKEGGGKKEGKKEAAAGGAAPKEGGKKEGAAKEGGGAAKKEEEEATIDMLDCRVGRIVKIDKHPNADALYLEEIDVGEEKPRQVISGLRNFVPLEQMQNRLVVVVCNLKPAKMREVMSYGMVLCASDEGHTKVDPVLVPEGVPIGERITVEGFTGEPPAELNPKKKVLERLFPDMKTDAAGVPVFKGKAMATSKGPLTSTIPNGWVR